LPRRKSRSLCRTLLGVKIAKRISAGRQRGSGRTSEFCCPGFVQRNSPTGAVVLRHPGTGFLTIPHQRSPLPAEINQPIIPVADGLTKLTLPPRSGILSEVEYYPAGLAHGDALVRKLPLVKSLTTFPDAHGGHGHWIENKWTRLVDWGDVLDSTINRA
jgi:hypothetical protein